MPKIITDQNERKTRYSSRISWWVLVWLRSHSTPMAQLIEAALIEQYKLKQPKK